MESVGSNLVQSGVGLSKAAATVKRPQLLDLLMKIDVDSATPIEIYHALVSVITPRPIAWVTTVDEAGRVNLAPYSFFNVFSSNPPVVVFSPGLRRDGSKKHTLLNVEATGEFVLNSAVEALAEQVNLSSKEIDYGESEVDLTGLTTIPSDVVRPPRIAESPVALECTLLQVIPLGDGSGAGNLVVGRVVKIHVDETVIGPDGRVDPTKLRTIGRMGGDHYCRTVDLFQLERPR
jgi:flavin reductase (DIM6/NTAB) family NADH-FMN oxidoreductase RutF